MPDALMDTLEMLVDYYKPADMTEKRLKTYIKGLADVPPEVIERVALDWIRGDGKWFPKVSELLHLAKMDTGLANADFRAYTAPADFDVLAAEEIRLKDQSAAGVFERRDWEALIERYRRADRLARAESLQLRLTYYIEESHVQDRKSTETRMVRDRQAA